MRKRELQDYYKVMFTDYPDVVNVEQLSEMLGGTSTKSIYRLLKSGEIKSCADCEYNKFGSGKNGAKACKQKRRIYLLREGEALPTILSLPTGSLGEFSKYVMRLLSKGKKTNAVVTKFTLKKAQNSGGINYSQAVFAVDRQLTAEEHQSILAMSEQVKVLASGVSALDEE